MKVALCNGKIVRAAGCRLDGPFICPECGQALSLMHGKRKHAYFVHTHDGDSHCHGETKLHQQGKSQMMKWAKAHGWHPQMEVFLPNVKQRPDLLIQVDQKPFVLEYQCSPLGLERLIERNHGYRSLHLPYCWFLGPRYRCRLHDSKVAQFTQWHQGQPVLPFWDLDNSRPEFQFNYLRVPFVQNINANKRIKYIRQTLALQEMMVMRTDKRWRSVHDQCYLQHHLMSACPLVAHPTKPQWPVVQGGELNWRIRCLLLFDLIPLGQAAPVVCWKNIFAKRAHWLPTPCLSVDNTLDLRSRIIDQLIQDLIDEKILQSDGEMLVFAEAPKWFIDADRKLKYIKTTPFL